MPLPADKRRKVERRGSRSEVVVHSDLPRFSGLAAWERQLLFPIAERLVAEALEDGGTQEHTPQRERHGEDKDEEP